MSTEISELCIDRFEKFFAAFHFVFERDVIDQGKKKIFDIFFQHIVEEFEGVIHSLFFSPGYVLIGPGDVIFWINERQQFEDVLETSGKFFF